MTDKERLMAILREQPGITMLELAQRTGLSAGAVWVTMSALRQEGSVKQQDRGWRVTDRAQ